MGAAAAAYIKSCRNRSKKVHGVNNSKAARFSRERRSRGRKEIQPLNFLFSEGIGRSSPVTSFDRRQTCLRWNVRPQLQPTKTMSDLQVQIDVVSNYPLIKQLTNPRADFCSLILSFLLPLSYCDKVGWVCIIFFLFSRTRRRRVGTNFPKGCPNGHNPRERERERGRNAVSKLGTRKKN
jgi:hypothetical protein